jgi:HD-GYP domain-containing protein (c-di-GMP phosphodiesterase class II)
VSRKILFVEGEHAVQEEFVRELRSKYEVAIAKSAEEGFELMRTSGPFAVVMAQTERGLGFLRELPPGPTTIGYTDAEEFGSVIARDAIADDHGFRFLEQPYTLAMLLRAVDEAFDAAIDLDATTREAESLVESLTSKLAGAPHARSLAETVALFACLQRLTESLTGARSIADIARFAAEAAHTALGGGGVHVQLWESTSGRVAVGADAGPEMSSKIHLEAIRGRDGQIGEIAVDALRPARGPFTPAEKALLSAIAGMTAVSAFNEFSRRAHERTHHATLVALARLAGRRDNETTKHLKRVEAYCRLISDGLKTNPIHAPMIDDEFVEHLAHASALHDIGEVGIPDSILMKSGKLKPEEWEIMKTHAEIGALTLDGVIREYGEQPFLAIGRDIAWCHHEKWDGSGYPRSLRGRDIPLAARILALADVYDALTTVRPYKTAWDHGDALEWVAAQSGFHFDPDVVTAFLTQQEHVDRIRIELADTLDELRSKNPDIFGVPADR